jgi:LacI family transcriptional regulator
VATIRDVAKRAGVSATTARRALTEPERLVSTTLERVQKAVRELNYEPDQSAGALRRGHTHTIGLMVGDVFEPFYAGLTRTISKALRDYGYALIVADSEYDSGIELENLRMFNGHRVNGMIIRSAYGSGNLDYLRRLHEQGTFILEIDKATDNSPFGHVILDNRDCVIQGVRYLHTLGHRRIAALSTYDPVQLQDERAQAFPEAMNVVGLKLPHAYLGPSKISEEGAYNRTLELMNLLRPPTAIFSLTGNEAAGAFRAIRELKLRIPDDVSLLTFDDYSWTSLVEPPLDVIEQPVEEMGLAAVQIVMEAIQKRDLETVVRKRFPGRLIRRGSCAPPLTSRQKA